MKNLKQNFLSIVAYTFVFFGMIFFYSSCKKEGCTDYSACNYSSEATKDDGTCNYGCNNGGSSSSSSSGGSSSSGSSSSGSSSSSSGGSAYGKVTFYTMSDFNCGNITVNVSGQGNEYITMYYTNGINGCDISGSANFTLLPGTYTYSASCSSYNWGPATFSISANGCLKYQLN